MAALSPDVSAALASLQARWGAAAPRIAGEQSSTSPRVIGALATVPLPDEAEPDEALPNERPLHHEMPLPGGHGVEIWPAPSIRSRPLPAASGSIGSSS